MEINTQIYTLEKLLNTDISHYDAIYLGDPFSIEYPENLILSLEDLKKSVHILKKNNKKAYLSTFSVPRDKDIPSMENLFKYIAKENIPIDMIEIHNFGLISLIREIIGDIPIHAGSVSNIYTVQTATLLKEKGVTRVTGNYELSLEELEEIKKIPIEVEILIHGRMVLGISEECPAIWWKGDEKKKAQLSKRILALHSSKMDLTVRGRTTLSGKDVCMMEHIPTLIEKGFSIFRIDSSVYPPEYTQKAGKYYKEIIEKYISQQYNPDEMEAQIKRYMEDLAKFNTKGFCNGYYFKTSGSKYIGK